MKDIMKQIEQFDELQLEQIIRAVLRRYNALRTDRKISILSLPTDPQSRDAELENIITFIRTIANRIPDKAVLRAPGDGCPYK